MEYPKKFSRSGAGTTPDFPGGGPGIEDWERDIMRRPFRDWERDWLRQPFPSRPTRPRVPPKVPRVPFKPKPTLPKVPFFPPWARIPMSPFGPFDFIWSPWDFIPWGVPGEKVNIPGWTQIRECQPWIKVPCMASSHYQNRVLIRNDGNLACFVGQAISSPKHPGDPIPDAWGIISGVNANPSCPTVIRYSEAVAFQRVGGYTGLPAPDLIPFAPMVPDPTVPNDAFPPDEFSHPQPEPVETGGPDPEPVIQPGKKTRSHPGLDTKITVDGPPKHEPPGPGVKERKFRITLNDSNLGKFISWAFGQITEYSDMVDCMWDALPNKTKAKYKRRQRLPANSPFADDQWCFWDDKNGEWVCGIGGRDPGLDVKTRVLYDHFFEMKLGTFLECVLENALVDSAVGRLGKIGVEAAIKQGRPITFEFGPAL